jgi:hypothetical protein
LAAAFAVADLAVAVAVRAALTVAERAAFAVAVAVRTALARPDTEGAGALVADSLDSFPVRCVEVVCEAFTWAVTLAEPAARREIVPGAAGRVFRVPLVGAAPSVGRRSGWSELMHLTSGWRTLLVAPGERSDSHVNTS